ncbi:restriction endonuclease subunit S [Listeria sp. FSL L7-1426]|uniref:restriction endonuclease subunit S n=1 Tax=Listeria cossartiae TaxID=2838249 RepID=UPI00162813D5|nr:restriction endonuclease subunit S [Listeria cossartiae]MBC1571313.1 restriction endonuclease subunit S [Listeria cossartiae subsp. cossartiae]
MSHINKRVPKRRFEEFNNADAWEQRKLGELAEIVRGASPRPIQDPKWFDNNSEVGWLRISDVTAQNGRINYLEQRISEAGQEKTRVLKEPHLLLSIAATVGKPVINYVKTGVHDGFLIFLDIKFEQEFLFQWLEMFRTSWQKYGQPGSQVNLNSELVRNQGILIPSMKEQIKISQLFQQLDNTIALHQRKLEKIKALKTAYLSEMFPAEGETKPKRRFGGFTDDWEQRKFSQVADIFDGTHQTPKYTDFGVKFVSVENIATMETKKYISQEAYDKEYSNKKVEQGDVLMTRIGDVGTAKVIETDEPLAYYVTLALLKPKGIDPDFLAQQIASPEVQRSIWKRTLHIAFPKKINLGEINQVSIFIPDLEEQAEIGIFFKKLDKTITLHQRKLQKLQNIKKAYLNEMFI